MRINPELMITPAPAKKGGVTGHTYRYVCVYIYTS